MLFFSLLKGFHKLQKQREYAGLRHFFRQHFICKFKHVRGCHILIQIFTYGVIALYDLTIVEIIIISAFKELIPAIAESSRRQSGLIAAALIDAGAYAYLSEFSRKQGDHPSPPCGFHLSQYDTLSICYHMFIPCIQNLKERGQNLSSSLSPLPTVQERLCSPGELRSRAGRSFLYL